MQEGESEWDEVERELGEQPNGAHTTDKGKGPAKTNARSDAVSTLKSFFHPVLVEAFVLTFLAEWGDRSQVCVALFLPDITTACYQAHLLLLACISNSIKRGRRIEILIREKQAL